MYRIGNESEKYRIKVSDHILDNIYGQIGITEVEKKIERLPIFKRLHDISQLGLVNWIFPCALHNRYIHSIGVMHIAGEMAQRINVNMGESFFDDTDIQIIRLAGLLHDIGHYPMSHNVEQAYKDSKNIKKYNNEPVSANLNYFVNCPEFLIPPTEDPSEDELGEIEHEKNDKLDAEEHFAKNMGGSSGFHHENIGRHIIANNRDIFNVVKENFILMNVNGELLLNPKFADEDVIKKNEVDEEYVDEVTQKLMFAIGEMVRGNYSYGLDTDYPWIEKYSAMIQLIHSDLDADNLDYLLRDAEFSGTSYGTMDMSILLNCLIIKKFTYEYEPDIKTYKYIVGIQEKGIGCVEQFLLNKFLAYSQMILTKYVSILESMLLRFETKYIIPEDRFYTGDKLKFLVQSENSEYDYLRFSDYYISGKINDWAEKAGGLEKLPKSISSHLKSFSAFNLADVEENEFICTALSEEKVKEEISKSNIYQRFLNLYDEVKDLKGVELGDKEANLFSFRFETYALSRQIPMRTFLSKFNFKDMELDRIFMCHYYRLGNGIPILKKTDTIEFKIDANKTVDCSEIPPLAVDHRRSSLREICSMKYVSLRQYDVRVYGEA